VKVELKNIESIRPYEQNPRLNDQAVEAVAKSLREFGFRQPIVVDTEGVIIVGHTRWKAAQKLGLQKVPVHVAKDLSPAQVKAYRLADNQTATLAEWNYDLLPLELKDLQGMDFDLSLLGFDETALAELLAPAGNEGLTDEDAVPLPGDAAITQPGDLWTLGNHRLLCGDSSKAEDVDRLLAGAPIHLVNTDPPYNVKVEPRSNNAIAAGMSSFPASDAHQRLIPCYARAKAIVDSGILGPLVHVAGLEQLDVAHSASFMRRYHRHRARSGGFLNTRSCHDLDFMNWCVGHQHKVVRVASFGGLNVFTPDKAPARRCRECPPGVHRACRYKDKAGYVFPIGAKEPLHKTRQADVYGGDLCVYTDDKSIVDNQTLIMEWDQGVRGNFNLELFQARERRTTQVWGENGLL